MTIHDSNTTTIEYGFRIDGCAGKGVTVTKEEMQKNKNLDNVVEFLSGKYFTNFKTNFHENR